METFKTYTVPLYVNCYYVNVVIVERVLNDLICYDTDI